MTKPPLLASGFIGSFKLEKQKCGDIIQMIFLWALLGADINIIEYRSHRKRRHSELWISVIISNNSQFLGFLWMKTTFGVISIAHHDSRVLSVIVQH